MIPSSISSRKSCDFLIFYILVLWVGGGKCIFISCIIRKLNLCMPNEMILRIHRSDKIRSYVQILKINPCMEKQDF